MAVTSSDIKFYRSASWIDGASGGGAIGTTEITGGANAIFPNISDEERTAGGSRYRKLYVKNDNSEDLGALNTLFGITTPTPQADYIRMKPGTDSDIQSDASAYTNWAGAGILDADASAGASSIDVEFDTNDGVYDGDDIRIDDGTNVEYHTVSGAPAWTGNVATITLTGTLSNSFAAADSPVVTTMLDFGTLEPTKNTWVETLTAGAYDEAQVVLYNEGTITESWTLTFTDASGSFSVSGASVGAVGTGSIASDFQPSNGTSSYFKLPTAGWSGGTPSSGDTVTWNTVHAAKSAWAKLVWGAGISSFAATANQYEFTLKTESE